jgi:hypothetical protein
MQIEIEILAFWAAAPLCTSAGLFGLTKISLKCMRFPGQSSYFLVVSWQDE